MQVAKEAVEVIAKVKGGGKELVILLEKEEMIQAKMTKSGAILVPLSADKDGVYKIPLPIRKKNPYILLHLEERGGNGFGQIVCDINGRRLRPFYVEKSVGRFNVANEAAIVCALSLQGSVSDLTIKTYSVRRNNSNVVIKKNRVFKGRNSNLPEHLSKFKDAAKAAVRKSQCQKCKHLHFVT